jgi:hypothetical protein
MVGRPALDRLGLHREVTPNETGHRVVSRKSLVRGDVIMLIDELPQRELHTDAGPAARGQGRKRFRQVIPAKTRLRRHQQRKDVTAEKHTPTIKTETKARAGVTGHNVRYVLAFGLAGAIIAFLIIGLYFYGFQF